MRPLPLPEIHFAGDRFLKSRPKRAGAAVRSVARRPRKTNGRGQHCPPDARGACPGRGAMRPSRSDFIVCGRGDNHAEIATDLPRCPPGEIRQGCGALSDGRSHPRRRRPRRGRTRPARLLAEPLLRSAQIRPGDGRAHLGSRRDGDAGHLDQLLRAAGGRLHFGTGRERTARHLRGAARGDRNIAPRRRSRVRLLEHPPQGRVGQGDRVDGQRDRFRI